MLESHVDPEAGLTARVQLHGFVCAGSSVRVRLREDADTLNTLVAEIRGLGQPS